MSTQISDQDIGDRLIYDLKAWLGPGVNAVELTPLRGGRSTECYSVRLTGASEELPERLVLRFAKDDFGAEQEQAIQNAVAESDFPAPRVWWARTPGGSMLGRPYVIMTWAEGRDPLAAGAARRIPTILAETMVGLHRRGPEVLQNFVRVREANWAPRIDNLIAVLRRSKYDGVRAGGDWLDAHSVDGGATVLCHGDLHAGNLLMSGGRVSAVLDWEIALFGPAEYDVARTELLLEMMPGVGGALLRPALRLLGRRLARQFVTTYREHATLDDQVLRLCRALHVLRLIDLVQGRPSEDRVRKLWQPFARELAARWQSLTGISV
jgi:aminoglycoside phosphotransferase (APT) family kinase protein